MTIRLYLDEDSMDRILVEALRSLVFGKIGIKVNIFWFNGFIHWLKLVVKRVTNSYANKYTR